MNQNVWCFRNWTATMPGVSSGAKHCDHPLHRSQRMDWVSPLQLDPQSDGCLVFCFLESLYNKSHCTVRITGNTSRYRFFNSTCVLRPFSAISCYVDTRNLTTTFGMFFLGNWQESFEDVDCTASFVTSCASLLIASWGTILNSGDIFSLIST